MKYILHPNLLQPIDSTTPLVKNDLYFVKPCFSVGKTRVSSTLHQSQVTPVDLTKVIEYLGCKYGIALIRKENRNFHV